MTAINNENDLFMFNNYVPHIDYFIPYMWEKKQHYTTHGWEW